MPETDDLTARIQSVVSGDVSDEVCAALVYQELRQIAERAMRGERNNHTLQPTALVNEAYMKLLGSKNIRIKSKEHFMAVAATVMRHILVDYARAHRAKKKGGDLARVTMPSAGDAQTEPSQIDLLALDEQLSLLAQLNKRQAEILELRFFAGYTIDEVSEVTGLARATVAKDVRNALNWLHARLKMTRG